MGCAMPQEEKQIVENQQQKQQADKDAAMAPLAEKGQQKSSSDVGGKLKGTHSALVKLLESAPIAQVRPILKQKSSTFNGNRTDQNHYRKSDLGTSKCPWKKSRICAEWLLKNQQDSTEQSTPAASSQETETMPKGEFLPPTNQQSEDVEMTELEGLTCTCHGMMPEEGSQEDQSLTRRNSSDSTDDDELTKCECGQCSKLAVGTRPTPLLHQQLRTSSVSDSGCEDSDCAENKITDLCNRFNENLSKDDVRPLNPSTHIIHYFFYIHM